MGGYAVIANGKVINTVLAELDYAAQQQWVFMPEKVGIGWDYVDGQFVDNRPVFEVVVPSTPTKEELLAQLQALQAQIAALP